MMLVIVKIQDQYTHQEWSKALSLEGTGFEEAFYPLRVTDDPLIAFATGDKLAGSESVRKIVKLREETAEKLSKAITEQLMLLMRREDTKNGYGDQL